MPIFIARPVYVSEFMINVCGGSRYVTLKVPQGLLWPEFQYIRESFSDAIFSNLEQCTPFPQHLLNVTLWSLFLIHAEARFLKHLKPLFRASQ